MDGVRVTGDAEQNKPEPNMEPLQEHMNNGAGGGTASCCHATEVTSHRSHPGEPCRTKAKPSDWSALVVTRLHHRTCAHPCWFANAWITVLHGAWSDILERAAYHGGGKRRRHRAEVGVHGGPIVPIVVIKKAPVVADRCRLWS